MTLTEMHVMFRQFAQQMGLQNVRAILPEQIDLLLNTSVSDTVNQIIQQNIGVTNDRIITDNSKIGQINALRTLYKTSEIEFESTEEDTGLYKVYVYEDKDIIPTPDVSNVSTASNLNPHPGRTKINPLFWVDFSINYVVNSKLTHWFPVRLIDDMFLADVLNDFVLKPTLRSPVVTMINSKAELYIGDLGSATVNKIRASYIAKPNIVKYLADIGGKNEECDLPDHLHPDIVKHAVELWQIAVNGTMATEQARQQRAQNMRASANRNEND